MARRKRKHRTVSPPDANRALRLVAEEVESHELLLSRLVGRAAAAGASGEAIAGELGVSRATLYRRFGLAMREGRTA